MWRYVALSQNLKKQSFSPFLLFSANFGKKEAWRYVAVSQNPEKTGVSTKRRRAMWRCPKIAIFSKCKKQSWGYVVYPKKIQRLNCSQCCFCCFQHLSQKYWWRYAEVAQHCATIMFFTLALMADKV